MARAQGMILKGRSLTDSCYIESTLLVGVKTMAEVTDPVKVNDSATPIQNPTNAFRAGGSDPKAAIANSPQKNPINPSK